MIKLVISIILCSIILVECNSIEILLIGSTGIGKSTLVNNLMSQNVAFVNHDDTGTTSVDMYNVTAYGFDFKLYDSPGLYDGNNDDKSIMKMIIDKKAMLNIILVCYDISQPRINSNDIKLKQDIVDNFGSDILNYVLVVYTKTNLLKEDEIYKRIETRHNRMNWTNTPWAYAYNEDHQSYWVRDLWFKMLDVSKKHGLSVFDIYKAGMNMLKLKVLNNPTPTPVVVPHYYYESTTRNRKDCIGIESIVYLLKDDEVIKTSLDNIQLGDFIKTDGGYSEVYFIYKHKQLGQLLRIRTFNDNIKVSNNHLVPVIRDEEEQLLKAKDIKIGDKLKTQFLGKSYWSDVTKIESYYGLSEYILTHDGTIIVDDITVSCYVSYWDKYLTCFLGILYELNPDYVNQNNLLIRIFKNIYEYIGPIC